jgi:hypothetical protein
VDLRYGHADDKSPLAMTLILPDDLAAFEARLSAHQLVRVTAALDDQRERFEGPQTCPSTSEPGNCYPYDLRLFMPRFAIETRVELQHVLGAAGMPLAFDPARADLTWIHVPEPGEARSYVKAVIHQANIDVNEKGTEAAAATAVGMDTGGGPSPLDEITLRLDHPFLFLSAMSRRAPSCSWAVSSIPLSPPGTERPPPRCPIIRRSRSVLTAIECHGHRLGSGSAARPDHRVTGRHDRPGYPPARCHW